MKRPDGPTVRRYLASQLDRMENHRWLAELSYLLQYGENLSVRTTAYRHDFHRDWFKLNGFDGGVSIPDVLANPTGGTRQVLYRVLTGVEDTSGGGSGLLVGSNDRIFVAQGVQSVGNWKLPDLGPVSQRLRFGARYHYDRIVREHSQAGYAMRSGRLIDEGGPLEVTTHNRGAARAFSAHLIDEIELWDLVLSPGVRFEVIETEFENFQTGERIEGNQRALLPGVGALYDLIDVKDGARVGLLAGVHHGFSPVSPGPSVTVEPEQSVGYEGGARLAWGAARAEAIGFYNDYSNLTAECTFSKGCPEQQLGEQINAGRVSLWGLETALSHEIATPVDLVLPVRAAYTYTGSRFGNSFVSDNPQFGAVQRGDELPYVPEHQGSVSAGAVFPTFGVNLTGRAMSAMRESAGQGEASPSELTDAHVVFGALLWFSPVDWAQIYLKADNLFNEQYIVSRRPFGARPGRPRFVALGLRSEL